MTQEQQEHEDTIDLGLIYCACGCGKPAERIYEGIPVPEQHPFMHWMSYKSLELEKQLKLILDDARKR